VRLGLRKTFKILAPGNSLRKRVVEARRAERNYLLLHDPMYRAANRESLARSREILSPIQDLEPQDSPEAQKALQALGVYEQTFGIRDGAHMGREMPTASRPWCALMRKI